VSPTVSILVAAYNVQDRLRECLSSIANQIFADFECIIVDDCSSDETNMISAEYADADSRFKLVRHDTNLGLPSARRSGFLHSTGEYIWYIDGDDYVTADGLEALVAVARRDGCDIVRGRYITKMNGRMHKNNITSKTPAFTNQSFTDLYTFLQAHGIWLNLFRHDFLKEINVPFYPNINLGEDLIYNSYAYLNSKQISVSDATIYIYNVRENSYTRVDMSKRRYLEEAKAHALCFQNYDTLPMVQLDFAMNHTNFRMNWTRSACKYLQRAEALQVIGEYKKLYHKSNPKIDFRLTAANRGMSWNPVKNPEALQFAEWLSGENVEKIYCHLKCEQ